MFNHNNFVNTKNQILSNVSKSNNDDKNMNETINDIDEKENLIKKEKIKKEIIDSFINPGKIVIHNAFSLTLNKWKFIENIFKELTKIPDNELLAESNNINNLINQTTYNVYFSSHFSYPLHPNKSFYKLNWSQKNMLLNNYLSYDSKKFLIHCFTSYSSIYLLI